MLVEAVSWVLLVALARAQRVLVTSLEDNTLPVFEVFDPEADQVRTVPKVLGEGRSRLGQAPGEGRLVEGGLVVQYRIESGEAWLVARLPPGTEGGAHVQFGDTICNVGGYNQTSGAASAAVSCWNPLGRGEAEEWAAVAAMDTARYRPGATVMDGKLFVAGGYDPRTHRFLESVAVLDDVTKQWYSLPPLNHARAGLGLVGVAGRLFAVGGWRDHKYSREVEMWDPLLDSWTSLAPLQERRGKLALVAAASGHIYAVAGVSGFRQTDNLDTIERYTVAEDRWDVMRARLSGVKGPVSAALVEL